MPSIDAQFALLVLFCGLSTQWLPVTFVDAAAISLQPPQARRSSMNNAGFGYQQDTTARKQLYLPWNGANQVEHDTEHDKRMESISKFAHDIYTGFENRLHRGKKQNNEPGRNRNRRDTYVSNRRTRAQTPLWRTGDNSHPGPQRRDGEEILGTIGIFSPMAISTEAKKVASLYLPYGSDVFSASDTNATQMTLSKVTTTPDSTTSGSSVILYILTNSTVKQCVTFEAQSSINKSEPLTSETCFGDQQAPSHKSQIFSFEPTTGAIRPMWFQGQDDDTHDTTSAQDVTSSSDASSTSASPSSASANATSTATSAQLSPSANLSSRENQPNTQNVTLKFIPNGRAAAKESTDDTASVTSSGLPSSTTALTSLSSTISASTSVFASAARIESFSASSASSSVSSAASSSAPSITSSTVTSSASPSQSVNGMRVELVGNDALPSSSSASVTSASASLTSTVTASSSVPARFADSSAASSSAISSVNAEAVASSIAASRSAAYSASQSSASASVSASSSSASPSASFLAAGDLSTDSASVSASSTISASASSSSPSASFSIAGLSPSDSASASASPSSSASLSASSSQASASASSNSDAQASGTFVAAVLQRAPIMTPVSTEPYSWKFRADSR